MSPKQKRALSVLIVSALAGLAAALAPKVACDPPEAQTIEDLIPDEPGTRGEPGHRKAPDLGGSDSSGIESSGSTSG